MEISNKKINKTYIVCMLALMELAFCRTPQEKRFGASCAEGQCESGTGTWVYDKGDKYVGQFQNGIPEGKGTLTSSDGITQVGEWNDGFRVGLFQITDNKKTKLPMEYYLKGNLLFKFTGNVDDSESGKGLFLYSKGDTYEGTFKNFKRDGQGTYKVKSGESYVGGWRSGKMEGKGILYTGKGSERYEGDFKEDEPSGKGIYYNENGSVRYSGVWDKGLNAVSQIESSFTFLFLCQDTSNTTCINYFTPYDRKQLGFLSAKDLALERCKKVNGKAIDGRCSTQNEIGRCVRVEKKDFNNLKSLLSEGDVVEVKSYYNASEFEKGKKNECEAGKSLTFQ